MDAEMKERLAEVYEGAADYLEKYGWCQQQTFNSFDGPMGDGNPSCFALAMREAAPGDIWYRAVDFAAEALELVEGDSGNQLTDHAVYRWNDDPDRTADEVINTLHALANKLR